MGVCMGCAWSAAGAVRGACMVCGMCVACAWHVHGVCMACTRCVHAHAHAHVHPTTCGLTAGAPPVSSAISRYWCSTNSLLGVTPSRCAVASRSQLSHSRLLSALSLASTPRLLKPLPPKSALSAARCFSLTSRLARCSSSCTPRSGLPPLLACAAMARCSSSSAASGCACVGLSSNAWLGSGLGSGLGVGVRVRVRLSGQWSGEGSGEGSALCMSACALRVSSLARAASLDAKRRPRSQHCAASS